MKKLINLRVFPFLSFLFFFTGGVSVTEAIEATEATEADYEEEENTANDDENQNEDETETKSRWKNRRNYRRNYRRNHTKKQRYVFDENNKAKEKMLEIIWARFAWEPSLREVQKIAVKQAFLKRKRVKSWIRRVRASAWLPDVRVKLDQNQGSELRLKGEPGTSSQWAEKEGDGLSYGVQLTWSFNRLVFDPDELKVNREAHRMVELREEIMHNVTRVFFERRRIQVMNYLRPPRTIRAAALRRLAKERLEGLLDSITGGWYAKELKKRHPR